MIILIVIFISGCVNSKESKEDILFEEPTNEKIIAKEDILFNAYIACMANCRSSGDARSSDICLADNCYPTLVQGIRQLGYNNSAPDEEFTSKLNAENTAFVLCSSDCDYMEENAMFTCLDKCFAKR